ncbi:DUF5994 family protein [Amycolatopsis jejuensis]|uniref:DUF5994 family protein n=1 Tax=Amycolatopsis jejuensis TaxID=330084 RepID=UPI0005274C04|nr:DUF5994 family protein [Amycolatopsis jejuensis]
MTVVRQRETSPEGKLGPPSAARRTVRLEGFRSTDPHTIMAPGTDSRRVSLLVVPPETPGGMARAVLRSAAATPPPRPGKSCSATAFPGPAVMPGELPGSVRV